LNTCADDNNCPDTTDLIDLIVCIGGDGTILYASTLFQQSCPPVLAMNMGSLGFLCPFNFKDYKEYVKTILRGDVPLLLRNRLRCTHTSVDFNSSSNGLCDSGDNESAIELNNNQPSFSLNEIVVGRGPS